MLPALGAYLLGEAREGLGDRRAEAVGLRKHGDKLAELFDLGAVGKVLPRLQTGSTGALLAIHLHELGVDVRVADCQFLADAQRGLVHAEAGINADDHQVQSIGDTAADTFAAAAGLPIEPEIRRYVA